MESELIYGVEPVLAVLEGRRRSTELILARKKGGPLGGILAAAEGKGVRIRETNRRELDNLLPGAIHQGVALRTEPYLYCNAGAVLDAEKPTGGGSRLALALSGVEDPRNLGAILRTAAAVGAAGAFIPKHRASPVSPSALKASAGLAEGLKTALVTNLARTLDEAKKEGWWIVGADAREGSAPWSIDLDRDVVLLMGGEGEGLGPMLRKSCDLAVALPMAPGVESLNVSAAASVVLYEIRRAQGWEGGGSR